MFLKWLVFGGLLVLALLNGIGLVAGSRDNDPLRWPAGPTRGALNQPAGTTR